MCEAYIECYSSNDELIFTAHYNIEREGDLQTVLDQVSGNYQINFIKYVNGNQYNQRATCELQQQEVAEQQVSNQPPAHQEGKGKGGESEQVDTETARIEIIQIRAEEDNQEKVDIDTPVVDNNLTIPSPGIPAPGMVETPTILIRSGGSDPVDTSNNLDTFSVIMGLIVIVASLAVGSILMKKSKHNIYDK